MSSFVYKAATTLESSNLCIIYQLGPVLNENILKMELNLIVFLAVIVVANEKKYEIELYSFYNIVMHLFIIYPPSGSPLTSEQRNDNQNQKNSLQLSMLTFVNKFRKTYANR